LIRLLKAHATCGAEITIVNHKSEIICKATKKGKFFIPLDVSGNNQFALAVPQTISYKITDAILNQTILEGAEQIKESIKKIEP
jgi:hypothetical protein